LARSSPATFSRPPLGFPRVTRPAEELDAFRIAHGCAVVAFVVLEFGLVVEMEARAIGAGVGE